MYKIVVDSCGELPEELKKDGHFETVSLELEVDGYRIKDDETFNQLDFLRRVKKREPERTKVLLPVTGAVYAGV